MTHRTRRSWTVALPLILSCGVPARGDHLRNLKPGQRMPTFALKTLDGHALDNAVFHGNVVVLVYLAGTQKSSEKAAIAAHDLVRALRHQEIRLVFVTADVSHAAYFREHRDKTNVHEPLGMDFDRDLYGKLGLIVLPTTIVIDREGRLAYIISGYKSDYEHVLDTYVRRTLGLIDDAEAKQRLRTEKFRRDQPADRAARHRAAARLLREKGLLRDAEKELEAAIKIDPKSMSARLDLASLYVEEKKIGAARRLVDDVLKAQPNHHGAKLMLGIVLFHSNALDEAERVLTEALVLNPDPARTHYYLGMLYEKKGDKDQALAHYREALSRVFHTPGR